MHRKSSAGSPLPKTSRPPRPGPGAGGDTPTSSGSRRLSAGTAPHPPSLVPLASPAPFEGAAHGQGQGQGLGRSQPPPAATPAAAAAAAAAAPTPTPRSSTTGNDAVRVVARIRPPTELEMRKGGGAICLSAPNPQTVDISQSEECGLENSQSFSFDRVFSPADSQEAIFEEVARPILDDVLRGFNGTIFAYGQTSSGKTYTMEGPCLTEGESRGIIPRAVAAIFEGIGSADPSLEFTLKVSYVEIYMERIRDLLDPFKTKTNLQVREDSRGQVYIAGVTEAYVTTEAELLAIMIEGQKNRAVAATGMNEGSSRSHSVFLITVTQRDLGAQAALTAVAGRNSKLVLVDLAGSEMVRKTGAAGQQLEEAKTINKSLSALGLVIAALTDGRSAHVPYRDSKLTRVLQDALGGNSKLALIINLSPSVLNSNETLSTLRFGVRAKGIRNRAVVNETRSAEEMALLLAKAEKEIYAQHTLIQTLEAQLKRYMKGASPSASSSSAVSRNSALAATMTSGGASTLRSTLLSSGSAGATTTTIATPAGAKTLSDTGSSLAFTFKGGRTTAAATTITTTTTTTTTSSSSRSGSRHRRSSGGRPSDASAGEEDEAGSIHPADAHDDDVVAAAVIPVTVAGPAAPESTGHEEEGEEEDDEDIARIPLAGSTEGATSAGGGEGGPAASPVSVSSAASASTAAAAPDVIGLLEARIAELNAELEEERAEGRRREEENKALALIAQEESTALAEARRRLQSLEEGQLALAKERDALRAEAEALRAQAAEKEAKHGFALEEARLHAQKCEAENARLSAELEDLTQRLAAASVSAAAVAVNALAATTSSLPLDDGSSTATAGMIEEKGDGDDGGDVSATTSTAGPTAAAAGEDAEESSGSGALVVPRVQASGSIGDGSVTMTEEEAAALKAKEQQLLRAAGHIRLLQTKLEELVSGHRLLIRRQRGLEGELGEARKRVGLRDERIKQLEEGQQLLEQALRRQEERHVGELAALREQVLLKLRQYGLAGSSPRQHPPQQQSSLHRGGLGPLGSGSFGSFADDDRPVSVSFNSSGKATAAEAALLGGTATSGLGLSISAMPRTIRGGTKANLGSSNANIQAELDADAALGESGSGLFARIKGGFLGSLLG